MTKAKRKSSNKIKRSTEDKVVDAVVWIVLIICFFIMAYPFWYIIVASFNNGYDLMRGGVYFFPREFTLQNYTMLLTDSKWISAFGVTVVRTVLGASLTVFMTCMVSYALSRKDLMFGKIYRFLVVFAMYVSGGLIPYYITLRNLGLLNSIWVYIIPSMLNLFFIMIGINFFGSIPDSLIESAKLDGASEMGILMRIVMPVSKAFIATLALFSAVNQWNSWMDSTYYVNKESLRTVAYRMMIEINQANVSTAVSGGQVMAKSTTLTTSATAMVVAMLPIMCVYPFLQKYFVQGMMLGAVKE